MRSEDLLVDENGSYVFTVGISNLTDIDGDGYVPSQVSRSLHASVVFVRRCASTAADAA